MGNIEKYFKSEVLKNRRAIETRDEPNDKDTVELYIIENAQVKKMCEDGNAKYFEIDGEYNKEIQKVYEWLDKQINR